MTVEEGGNFVKGNEHLGKRADSIFTFSDCRYVIKGKEILKGLSGTVKSGEVLAIVGPSGAGKTMLMNVFSLKSGPGRREGRVTLNSRDVTLSKFKKYFSVVEQQDNHWAYLTPREAITLATELQHTYSAEQTVQIVDSLIENMGLTGCQNTRVGNQFIQGLSGGQKRRLSLAIALVKKPCVILLDEPTSGLDAAAATSIMSFFKDLAQNLNIVIACTIHQPSTKVYNGFDLAMVLTGGRSAFFGPASFLGDYLQLIDRPIPRNSNPAEHVLDLVNREFTSPKEVDYMIDSWKAYSDKETRNPDSYLHKIAEEIANQKKGRGGSLPEPEPSPGALSQVGTLLKRQTILTIRDPIMYFGRAVAFLVACTFFSFVYLESRERTQSQAPYKLFLFMWHIGVPCALGVVAVIAYNMEFVSIKREVKQGQYSPSSYVFASSILQLPMMFVLGIAALTVGGYCVSLYHVPMYGQMLMLYASTLWTFESMAQLFAVQFPNPLLGMLAYMNLWFSSFLFCGIMVPEADVPWPLKVFCYILPLKYFLKSAMHTDLHETTFRGAMLDSEDPRGFSCRNATGDQGAGAESSLACYGYTGHQVLDSVGVTYRSIESKSTYVEDLLIILAIGILFKVMGTLVTITACRAQKGLSKPSKESSTEEEETT
ncbi:ATP-binding cassette transporter [Chloropicon primus]|uniref:ATP-binding cassette transporter n=1 Tax=Chloropicon primus TaxID=1764295 RepID=A0A5B8MHP6_9CHLO|nr:ATP-binding cassette transporter [Chloropicon primus]UPQ99168.1 ATP-binding cassette transporter [Chloropicon primus]|eukprot:QDZ19957.1 ATP-binding cassette transporter [Chloropicon primus]